MGLDINALYFLIAARQQGASFNQVITVGRPEVGINLNLLENELKQYRFPLKKSIRDLWTKEPYFAEPIFEALGAQSISTLDASNFMGANTIHDMNLPLPNSLKNRFDIVYDTGSLEHIFNFPVAIKNCMEMLKENGRLIIHTTANNCMGHGFYQFSPELFYRIFSEENGFEVERLILHPVGPYGKWYQANDPKTIKCRVELISLRPIYLLLQARKIVSRTLFETSPQQSDYQAAWDNTATYSLTSKKQKRWQKFGKLTPRLARFFRALSHGYEYYTTQSLRNKKLFKHQPKKPTQPLTK
ncbi:MAG: class I SAM-dependent methyltransferase [Verrucomicrobiae bacterium]|nr:class I SAM-dependent methyltransferase [Verrucomicrobiae bacterium]